jgi:hypothetical protein
MSKRRINTGSSNGAIDAGKAQLPVTPIVDSAGANRKSKQGRKQWSRHLGPGLFGHSAEKRLS